MNTKTRIVSSTDGKIREIICLETPMGRTNKLNTYLGLSVAFKKQAIRGIKEIINLNPFFIKRIKDEYPGNNLPSTPAEVLEAAIGKDNFQYLKQKNKDNTEFNDLFNGPAPIDGNRTNSATEELKNEIAHLAKKRIIEELQLCFPGEKKHPEIIIEVSFDERVTHQGFSNYLQDLFIATRSHNGKKFQALYSANNRELFDSIVLFKKNIPEVEPVPVNYTDFEGGNILASKNFAIIGRNILEKSFKQYANGEKLEVYRKKTEKDLKQKLGVSHIIWTGFKKAIIAPGFSGLSHQPLYHIDLYLAPSGIIIKKDGKKHHLIFIGQIDPAYYDNSYLDKGNRRKIIKDLNDLIQQARKDFIKYYNDNKQKGLLPFSFVNIPLVVQFFSEAPGAVDVIEERLIQSYLNVHIEVYLKNRNVYLPVYHNKTIVDPTAPQRPNNVETDVMTENAMLNAAMEYNRFGFNVVFVLPHANARMFEGGALHCYSKVIWRDKP